MCERSKHFCSRIRKTLSNSWENLIFSEWNQFQLNYRSSRVFHAYWCAEFSILSKIFFCSNWFGEKFELRVLKVDTRAKLEKGFVCTNAKTWKSQQQAGKTESPWHQQDFLLRRPWFQWTADEALRDKKSVVLYAKSFVSWKSILDLLRCEKVIKLGEIFRKNFHAHSNRRRFVSSLSH